MYSSPSDQLLSLIGFGLFCGAVFLGILAIICMFTVMSNLKQMVKLLNKLVMIQEVNDVRIVCPCSYCGGNLNFPAHRTGEVVRCSHCPQMTALFNPQAIR